MKKLKLMLLIGLIALVAGLSGCASDGSNGAAGAPGVGTPGASSYDIAVANGFVGTETEWLASLDPTNPLSIAANVDPEQCAICHSGNVARSGESHQAIYNQYTDTSDLALSIVSLVPVDNGDGTFGSTLTFHITKAGANYVAAVSGSTIAGLEQLRFGFATNDAAGSFPLGGYLTGTMTSLGAGTYQIVTAATVSGTTNVDLSSNAIYYGYIADTILDVEGMTLYDNVSNAGVQNGGFTNTSTAHVSACEKCHGAPYMKHGYRNPVVAGLDDFASCKICHFDTGNGGHQAWQLLVDDPAAYAAQNGVPTTAQKALYNYKKTIMNDVHMSHAMEFAYPQSMGNCTTCHAGNMTAVTDPSNFVAGTCKSCHPITGVGGTNSKRAPALKDLWANHAGGSVAGSHTSLDLSNNATDCTPCHNGSIARTFATLHSGFDSVIYAADGTKYADAITTSIGTVTVTGDVMTIPFTATGTAGALDSANIIPTVMVSFYGYGTKDFIVSNHSRDTNGLRMEFTLGAADNALYTTVSNTPGAWEVQLNMAAFGASPTIPEMIASGVIKRAEIAVMPQLLDGTTTVGLNAPSKTFDLATNAADPTFYAPIVDVVKCNKCHDQLATTFHSGTRGGNVTVCRMCHVPSSGGSHLELQSRSIDSYVHAIHSFQLFDPADIDTTDPVAVLEAQEHVAHQFPNFTRLNCEGCHVNATAARVAYNVPDQSKSLPGVLSGSDAVAGRNIGTIPAVVTGPGARACGACHRANFINVDDAGGLAAFSQHTKANGYAVEDAPGVLDIVVAKIMGIFN